MFARVMRKDDDGYVIVTPGEKVPCEVEDLPFEAHLSEVDDTGYLFMTTNVGDVVRVDDAHEVVIDTSPSGDAMPRVRVRHDLWARISRPTYLELVGMATEVESEQRVTFQLASGPHHFTLGTIAVDGH